MKFWRICVSFIMTAICMTTLLAGSCGAVPKSLLVMPLDKAFTLSDFEDEQDAEDVVKFMTGKLDVAFKGTSSYDVMEPSMYYKRLRDEDRAKLFDDVSYAAELGKSLGVRFVVTGRITEVNTERVKRGSVLNRLTAKMEGNYQSHIGLELKLVNCSKGIAAATKNYKVVRSGHTADEAFSNACTFAADSFVDELIDSAGNVAQKKSASAGLVTEVKNDIIKIDQGANASFFEDEILFIVRDEKIIGEAQVLEINKDYTVCRIFKNQEEIKTGDSVQRNK
ncbi:hypothetical protein SAMN05216582_10674 [Selenomonas ruminantium]|uniref:Curli production assembly/transport component CsgG n=1 Tax=Selenomonas ruminantium TaxID=971 RepID=A0A1M6T4G0_SELRU|nr:hypothetical protein [Selenomonas ruminantium]SHK51875.1 hypothetical protein SAMN05216582_10674 [Selenomonas ruminantium]